MFICSNIQPSWQLSHPRQICQRDENFLDTTNWPFDNWCLGKFAKLSLYHPLWKLKLFLFVYKCWFLTVGQCRILLRILQPFWILWSLSKSWPSGGVVGSSTPSHSLRSEHPVVPNSTIPSWNSFSFWIAISTAWVNLGFRFSAIQAFISFLRVMLWRPLMNSGIMP